MIFHDTYYCQTADTTEVVITSAKGAPTFVLDFVLMLN
jgi:hypothetical protein